MKVDELLAEVVPLQNQLDAVQRRERALKVQKARIKAQKAQQQLHAAQAPEKP